MFPRLSRARCLGSPLFVLVKLLTRKSTRWVKHFDDFCLVGRRFSIRGKEDFDFCPPHLSNTHAERFRIQLCAAIDLSLVKKDDNAANPRHCLIDQRCRRLERYCTSLKRPPYSSAPLEYSTMATPMDEDAVAADAAKIEAQLAAFMSPISTPFGSGIAQPEVSDGFQMDAMDWMEQELEGGGSAPTPTTHDQTTPIRTSLLERSSTPVMSNSSTKKDKPIAPVQTPVAAKRTPMTPRLLVGASGSSFVYRRYHDALKTYLQAKRSISHRMDLDYQSHLLTAEEETFTSSMIPEEAKAEVDFVKALHQQCWQNQQREEGNLWLLLVMLRRLGLSALVWDDDDASLHQHSSSQSHFLQRLSYEASKTPKELLEEFSSKSAPLGIQRLQEIVHWIQACLDLVKVAPKTTNLSSASHPDDEVPSLVQEGQAHLLRSCLSYILAGRLEDSKNIARSQGQSWRAAAWMGGEVDGHTRVTNDRTREVDMKPTGNPNRFLWKRQCWKSGQRCQTPEEAAIYSYLANDYHSCLSNPSLRSWESGLACVMNSILGRIQDELFHQHNNHRRQCQPPPAGTEWFDQETEQLVATATLSGMTERQMIQLLNSSPFETMRTTGIYATAMAAFLIGKSAILEFCAAETAEMSQADEEELRFLTHLTLYLDSLQDNSRTPIHLNNMVNQKNKVLFDYVQHIQTRPDLWHMMALYVSLLPEEKIIEFYPSFLVHVVESKERHTMLEQIRELSPDVETQVLRQVVRLALSCDSDDETKCHSIEWLLQDHYGEALICTNILLRDFFMNEMEDKMEAAMHFVDDYLPSDLLESAEGGLDVLRASSEYSAFTSYLDALQTFGEWKEVMGNTPSSVQSKLMDLSNLNATELPIAQARLVKDWVREKKTKCEIIVEAAEKARKALHEVLVFTGGWLAKDDCLGGTSEERIRQRQLSEIRSSYLALAVNLYHQVCEETALWMSRNLDDAPSDGMDRKKILECLNDPQYAPSHWYDHALDLASIVAKDENGIRTSIKLEALNEFLSKLAETAVSKLMHAA